MSEETEQDGFKKAFDELETSEILKTAWNSKAETIEAVLSKLSEQMNLDLSEASKWFEELHSQLDYEDVLSKSMTIDQFKRRLGNYLLSKSAKLNQIKDIREYILSIRKKSPNLFIFSDKRIYIQFQESSSSWISLFLNGHASDIMESFNQFSGGSSEIPSEKVKHFFKHSLKLLHLKVDDSSVKDFFHSITKPMSLREIIKTMENWAVSHPEVLKSFSNKLELTCLTFQDFEDKHRNHMRSSLVDLNYKLQKLAEKHRSHKTEAEKGAEEVFNFYSRALLTFGTRPSFNDIESHNTTLTLTKFMKFCKDFGIVSHQNKPEVMSVFRKNATNGLFMTLTQFYESFDSLGELFYNKKYDEENDTMHFDKTVIEKRELLYKHIGLHKRNVYMKKVKGFGLPFRSGKEFRIPENDPSKSYKFRKYTPIGFRESPNQSQRNYKRENPYVPQHRPTPPPKLKPKITRYRIRGDGYRSRADSEVQRGPLVTFQSLDANPIMTQFGQEYLNELIAPYKKKREQSLFYGIDKHISDQLKRFVSGN